MKFKFLFLLIIIISCSDSDTDDIMEINITTKTIENVTAKGATGGGIINDDRGEIITSKGICLSTSQSPTIDDNHLEDNSNNYDFNSEITGLLENTMYLSLIHI